MSGTVRERKGKAAASAALTPPPPRPPLHAPAPPQGWIPRTGLQYGCDLVLYQRHPALAHSDYAVTIVPLPPADGSEGRAEERRPAMGWHDLQISNRLAAQASRGASAAPAAPCHVAPRARCSACWPGQAPGLRRGAC